MLPQRAQMALQIGGRGAAFAVIGAGDLSLQHGGQALMKGCDIAGRKGQRGAVSRLMRPAAV